MRAFVSFVSLAFVFTAAASDAESFSSLLPGPQGPGGYTFKSPGGAFTIVEHWVRPDYVASDKDCDFGECGWRAIVHFTDKSKPDVILADEPEWYAWPADYRISSDEKWIIRDQKTGSGENSFVLYRVSADGDIWRRAQAVDDAVFAAVLSPLHRTRADYYHLEVRLVSWDPPAARLHLKAYATPNNRKDDLIDGRAVAYDLNKHVATLE